MGMYTEKVSKEGRGKKNPPTMLQIKSPIVS